MPALRHTTNNLSFHYSHMREQKRNVTVSHFDICDSDFLADNLGILTRARGTTWIDFSFLSISFFFFL